MKNKIEMTAKQIASLDLLISKKQANSPDNCLDVANNLIVVVTVTTDATLDNVVAAEATFPAVAVNNVGSDFASNDKAMREHLNEVGKNMSLEALIELRNSAIAKE